MCDLNARIVADVEPSLGVRPVRRAYTIRNTDRSTGARLAGVIARRFGDRGAPHAVRLEFDGTAGQSFGAFLLPGMRLEIAGEVNDYLAKDMHGGEIVIRNDSDVAGVLAGNTALYGATGGAVFIAGSAGERFGVRNSGAIAVVEGVGDHGCEYMTGGIVVVLGAVGRNFAAGMTGGCAYVWDPEGQLDRLCNRELVRIGALGRYDVGEARALIGAHCELTKSRLAAALLGRWSESVREFRAVVPLDSPATVGRHHTITPRAPSPRARAANASLISASG